METNTTTAPLDATIPDNFDPYSGVTDTRLTTTPANPDAVAYHLARCSVCVSGIATVQLASRRARTGGTWFLSDPLCDMCADAYGHGGVVDIDSVVDLPL